MFGKWDAKDALLETQCVIDFEAEEQIYDALLNQKKKAVFVYFYVPGHMIHENFNRIFEKESSRYANKPDPTDDIVFMRVSCQTHLNYCLNKYWMGRQSPVAEVFYLNSQNKIELSDFDDRHRSAAGI